MTPSATRTSDPLPPARTPRARAIYWITSIALAAGLLYWSLRGIDWARVWRALAAARPAPIAACAVLITVTLVLRAIRWRLLLSAEGSVGVADAFWATSAGYLGNNFLPARAGEVVRTMIIAARVGISRTFILTTALSERIVDALLLVLIAISVLASFPSKPLWVQQAIKPLAAIALVGALTIAVLPHLESACEAICARMPIPETLRVRLIHLITQILLGLRSFHSVRRLVGFLGFAVVIWCFEAMTFVVEAQAVGLVLTLPVALLLITGLGLASALPSTPGYIGIYQFVVVTVLAPFGFRRDDAIAYILLVQAVQYVTIMFWGLLALWVTGAKRSAAAPATLFGALQTELHDVTERPVQ